MPGTAAGTVRFKTAYRPLGDFFDAGLSRIVFAGNHHARLENHAFEMNALSASCAKVIRRVSSVTSWQRSML